MPKFSSGSIQKLNECDERIQIVCNEAIKFIDFTIVTGHRNERDQNALYPKYTKVKWPNSKHNTYPSIAVDVAPYIKPYGIIFGHKEQLQEIMYKNNISKQEANDFVLKCYARLIGYLEGVASQMGVKFRIGMDWDGDFDMLDQSFHDLGHLELM